MSLRPIIINVCGGPGAGKTTTALGVTSRLKAQGEAAIYVPEAALDLCMEMKLGERTAQFDILKEQVLRLLRTFGTGYRVVVTDSPIILQAAYCDNLVDRTRAVEVAKALNGPSDCFYVIENRRSNHSMVGRDRTKEQSEALDGTIKDLLDEAGFSYDTLKKHEAIDRIVEDVSLMLCIEDGKCLRA